MAVVAALMYNLEMRTPCFVLSPVGGVESDGGCPEFGRADRVRPDLRGAARMASAPADGEHRWAAQRVSGPAAELVSSPPCLSYGHDENLWFRLDNRVLLHPSYSCDEHSGSVGTAEFSSGSHSHGLICVSHSHGLICVCEVKI